MQVAAKGAFLAHFAGAGIDAAVEDGSILLERMHEETSCILSSIALLRPSATINVEKKKGTSGPARPRVPARVVASPSNDSILPSGHHSRQTRRVVFLWQRLPKMTERLCLIGA